MTPFCQSFSESSYEIYLRILENKISFPYGFDNVTKDLVTQLCHADLKKRLVEPKLIAASKYWEIPWEHVMNRRLVPPHIPRINSNINSQSDVISEMSGLNIGGDTSQFDIYSDGDKPMDGIGKPGTTIEFIGF